MPEVDAQLIKEARVSEEKDKFVVLVWDEMKICQDLVFNKHSCELMGFLNIGDVNAQLDKASEDLNSNSSHKDTRAAFHDKRNVFLKHRRCTVSTVSIGLGSS